MGSKAWTLQIPIQLSEKGAPISDPTFRFNFCTHFAAEGCPPEIGLQNWKQNWISKLELKERTQLRPNFSIQFSWPAPAGGLAWTTADGFRSPGDNHPQLAVDKAAAQSVLGGSKIRRIRFFCDSEHWFVMRGCSSCCALLCQHPHIHHLHPQMMISPPQYLCLSVALSGSTHQGLGQRRCTVVDSKTCTQVSDMVAAN